MPKSQRKQVKKEAKKTPQTDSLRTYELVFVVSSVVKAEKRKDVLAAVQKAIESQQGTVKKVEEWGLKDLAYAIRHQLSGWYASFTVELPPQGVAPINEALIRNDNILRHLLIKE